jgi:hypothetical protein
LNGFKTQTVHEIDVANRPGAEAPKMSVDYDNWFTTMIHSIPNPLAGLGIHIDVTSWKFVSVVVIAGLIAMIIRQSRQISRIANNNGNNNP